MIHYHRTAWYGLHYLTTLHRSVLVRAVPACIVAGVLNVLVHMEILQLSSRDVPAGEWLSHPYTFQLVGIVFGYLMVTRINTSYARYWEGVTMVKNMHSKWADACGQIIAFDRSLSTECNLTGDPFCCHIVRLFSQMSAMATMRLHIVEAGESILFDVIEGKHPSRLSLPRLPVGHRNSRRGSNAKVSPDLPERDSISKSQANIMSDLEGYAKSELAAVTKAASQYSGHDPRRKNRADKVHELAEGITKPERDLLLAAPCPVFATASRIQRAITTRLHAGGMRAPAPIVSRIFQEVSNGLLFYNNATKMKEIAVPYPYVQLNALLLNVFSCILTPVAIASFTPELWVSLGTTVVTVFSFYSVFIVANELEDPFGTEANDMPMIEFHEEFCASLCTLITHAWLPEDQWLVKEGRWVKPRNIAVGINGFLGAVGKRGVQTSRSNAGGVNSPYNTLLNRSKSRSRSSNAYTMLLNRARLSSRSMSSQAGAQRTSRFPGVVSAHNLDEKAVVIQSAVRRTQERRRSMVAEGNVPVPPKSSTKPTLAANDAP